MNSKYDSETMIDTKFRGMGIALVTPFKEDNSIDYEALGRLLDYQLQNDVDYIVALGTSAETPTLTEDEKKEVLNFILGKVNGRVPVVLGLGGNNTSALVSDIKTRDFNGIDAILSVVPYYNKPSQEGMFQHYSTLAEVSPVPIILYNVPGRTGVNMQAETTIRLARKYKNIVAIKEASGNVVQINDIIKNKPDNFNVHGSSGGYFRNWQCLS